MAGTLIAGVAFAHPQGTARTFEQSGQRLDRTFAQLFAGLALGERAGEVEPLFAVVVAVAEEMLGQEYAQAGAQGAGKHQQHQQHGGGKNEYGLHHVAPFAAEQAQVIACAGHQQQIDACTQQAGGVERHAAGQSDRRGPFRVAGGGDGDQRRHQGGHIAPRGPHLGIHRIEQCSIGVKVEIVNKQPAQSQAEKFDRPAILRTGTAIHLFSEHQTHDGEQDQSQIACPPRQHRLGRRDEGVHAGDEQGADEHAAQGADEAQRRRQDCVSGQAQMEDVQQ